MYLLYNINQGTAFIYGYQAMSMEITTNCMIVHGIMKGLTAKLSHISNTTNTPFCSSNLYIVDAEKQQQLFCFGSRRAIQTYNIQYFLFFYIFFFYVVCVGIVESCNVKLKLTCMAYILNLLQIALYIFIPTECS